MFPKHSRPYKVNADSENLDTLVSGMLPGGQWSQGVEGQNFETDASSRTMSNLPRNDTTSETTTGSCKIKRFRLDLCLSLSFQVPTPPCHGPIFLLFFLGRFPEHWLQECVGAEDVSISGYRCAMPTPKAARVHLMNLMAFSSFFPIHSDIVASTLDFLRRWQDRVKKCQERIPNI